MCRIWEHTLPGVPESVCRVRRWIEAVLTDTPVDACATEQTVYAASELATNAVRYVRHEVARFQ